jgi:hypothetical protein
MTDSHKPLLARSAALLVGPFLLGQRALNLLLPDRDAPQEPLPKDATFRITVTPPEHAIKRRG